MSIVVAAWHEMGRAALQRRHRIGVLPAGRAVVGPLEALDRLRIGRIERARRKAGIGFGERLHALKVVGPVVGMVNPVNREAEQAGAIRLGQVEAQRHDIGAGDGMDFRPAVARVTRRRSLPR